MKPQLDKERITEGVGGQAVIEGIMLRNKTHYVVACRRPDGTLTYIKKLVPENKNPMAKWVFFRGIVNLFAMLKLGYSTLIYSSNENLKEGEKKEEITPLGMTFATITSMIFAVGIFVVLPYIVTNLLGIDEKTAPIEFNILRGGIKICIFILYLGFMHFFKDIRRVFEYHGAEHIVVNAYEHGENPDKENIKKYSTIHPRCGTTFMFLVLSISIVLYMFTSYLVYNIIYANGIPSETIARATVVLCNIALLPMVSGISYEILKLGFRFNNFPLIKLIILPGLLLQRITTKQPQEDEVEVALFALDRLLDTSVDYKDVDEDNSDNASNTNADANHTDSDSKSTEGNSEALEALEASETSTTDNTENAK